MISVKVSDKNKTSAVKAEFEATLGTPALSGEFKDKANASKDEIRNPTKKTVTINWSGGGRIKGNDVIWDLNNLTVATWTFPDLMAQCVPMIRAFSPRLT